MEFLCDEETETGKRVADSLYVHRTNDALLRTDTPYEEALMRLPRGWSYDVVKFNSRTGAFTFTQSPDFHTAHEPCVGDAYLVRPDEPLRFMPAQDDPYIYHHKWLMVDRDYPGFDRDREWMRSTLWALLPDVDRSRIGRRSYWAAHVLPWLDSVWPDEENAASARTNIRPHTLPALFKRMEEVWARELSCSNLDIGGGRYEDVTEWLASRGVRNQVYDSYNRTPCHNASVLMQTKRHPVGSVTLSNVLNVLPTPEMRRGALLLAKYASRPGAVIGVTCYCDPKISRGKNPNTGSWQENRKIEEYLDEVRAVFPDAQVMPGRWIKAVNRG